MCCYQLVCELEKLLLMDEDASEVARLKRELEKAHNAKVDGECREATLVKEKHLVDEKVLSLLMERSSLITDRDTYSTMVKKFELRVAELERSLYEKDEALEAVKREREGARLEVGEVRKELESLQCEALSAFEGGYRNCWSRFAGGANPDPRANTFEIFLSDLRAKGGQDGVGSSNQPEGATA